MTNDKMGKITFVLGGVRSGKSQQALKLAGICGGKVAFLATCEALDSEMKRRITLHKNSRPSHWKTFEEPRNTEGVLEKIGPKFNVIIIDCLTLLVSNLLLGGLREKIITAKVKKICSILKKIKADSIIVSNEVGLGVVPDNKLARQFRDIAGRANQIVAAEADEVYFMVSGISWRVK